jgi:hypothetical protein
VTARKVIGDSSTVAIRTNRIGLLTIHANAPIVDGEVTDSRLTFTVRIDEVRTGVLQFSGQREGEVFSGSATAGQISVPLALSTQQEQMSLSVRGTSSFTDIHLPLPGLSHIHHLEVDIDGRLHLA